MSKPAPYITATEGMRGFFAVMVHWNTDHGGFWEPYTTSECSYATREEAMVEAREWAEAEGLECRA